MANKFNRQLKRKKLESEIFNSIKVSDEVKEKVDKHFENSNSKKLT